VFGVAEVVVELGFVVVDLSDGGWSVTEREVRVDGGCGNASGVRS
jgi:hypothetical protein